MKPKELEKKLESDGWVYDNSKGSHKHYKHPTKKGKITIPFHNKDLKVGTLKKILKDAGLK